MIRFTETVITQALDILLLNVLYLTGMNSWQIDASAMHPTKRQRPQQGAVFNSVLALSSCPVGGA